MFNCIEYVQNYINIHFIILSCKVFTKTYKVYLSLAKHNILRGILRCAQETNLNDNQCMLCHRAAFTSEENLRTPTSFTDEFQGNPCGRAFNRAYIYRGHNAQLVGWEGGRKKIFSALMLFRFRSI
jgi:hypothetical protein